MSKKISDFEVKERIKNLKSIERCDSFEKNMELKGYSHLKNYLSRQRVFIRSGELLDVFNFNIKDEGVTEKFITDFLEALAAYEEYLSSKNSRRTIAQKLRQSVKRNGLKNAIIKTTSKKTTQGSDYLFEAGLDEFTLEKVILDNHELFEDDHVEFVRDKLNFNKK
jgi:translation elongation factor EF-G